MENDEWNFENPEEMCKIVDYYKGLGINNLDIIRDVVNIRIKINTYTRVINDLISLGWGHGDTYLTLLCLQNERKNLINDINTILDNEVIKNVNRWLNKESE